MLPQAETVEESGWNEPPGFHLIPLPFADDLRAAPIDQAARGASQYAIYLRENNSYISGYSLG